MQTPGSAPRCLGSASGLHEAGLGGLTSRVPSSSGRTELHEGRTADARFSQPRAEMLAAGLAPVCRMLSPQGRWHWVEGACGEFSPRRLGPQATLV